MMFCPKKWQKIELQMQSKKWNWLWTPGLKGNKKNYWFIFLNTAKDDELSALCIRSEKICISYRKPGESYGKKIELSQYTVVLNTGFGRTMERAGSPFNKKLCFQVSFFVSSITVALRPPGLNPRMFDSNYFHIQFHL